VVAIEMGKATMPLKNVRRESGTHIMQWPMQKPLECVQYPFLPNFDDAAMDEEAAGDGLIVYSLALRSRETCLVSYSLRPQIMVAEATGCCPGIIVARSSRS
jgi:hypothetical protein